jgi:hypothetical protein
MKNALTDDQIAHCFGKLRTSFLMPPRTLVVVRLKRGGPGRGRVAAAATEMLEVSDHGS